MKIAFIDNSGSLFSIAWTVKEEGHESLYTILGTDKEAKRIGSGLVDKADRIKDVIEWIPDVAVLYNVPGITADLEAAGISNFGSSFAGKKLEDDRMYSCDLVRQLGIGQCPETHEFRSINDARRFLNDASKRRKEWVFKAQGGSSVDVSTTHVTEGIDHLEEILDFEETLNRAKSFILQERIDGIEISIEGFFHHKTGWIQPINSTLERKKLMNDDKGPMTGCMGSIVWGWPQTQPKLFRQTLFHMTDWLTRMKFKGPIDGNFIIDYKTHQPWFLEFTPRFGWNAFEAVMAGFKGNIGEFLVNFGRGTGRQMSFTNRFMGAVRIYTPAVGNIPIRAPIREDPRLFPKDIYYDEKTKVLRTVGTDVCNGLSVIFEAGGTGESIRECMAEIYENVIPEITASDLAYRTDLGVKAADDVEILEEFGYIIKGRGGEMVKQSSREPVQDEIEYPEDQDTP